MATIDRILDRFYRISTFDDKIGITFNQYLLLDDKPTLMHTGAAPIFNEVIEAISKVARPQDLAYVFVSHFEADECGSIVRFQEVAPGLVPVCPAVTARQLSGFGLCQKALAMKPGDSLDLSLNLGQRRLRFLAYPSEMHLWEGLIAYEETDRVLFTSDLFIRRGQPEKPLVDGKRAEFQDIPAMSIPSPEGRQACLESIKVLDIRIMALGHGPAVQITG